VPVWYKGRLLGFQRIDMVVDDKVIIETKSTHNLPRIASRQLYNYLKATRFEIGLLLHFGPEPGFNRLILRNHKKTSPSSKSSRASH
jgi:GxxExxY protein